MRVLVIGRTKSFYDATRVCEAATRAGHLCAHVDDRKLRQIIGARAGSGWLRARATAFRPDRVICFKPHDVTLDAFAWLAARFPITMWYRDLTIPPDPPQVARARHCDVTFLTAGGQAPEWRALGVPTVHFLPDAADAAESAPQRYDPDYACDVAFIGRGYDEQRAALLCRLAERFHVRVWGQDWDRWREPLNWNGRVAYEREFATICASAKIMLGINPAFHVQHRIWAYTSNRMVRTIACGAFYLTERIPGVDGIFRDGEHAAYYGDEPELIGQVERYLADDEARRTIAAGGREFVLQHHTYDRRLPNLLGGQPWQNPLDPDWQER